MACTQPSIREVHVTHSEGKPPAVVMPTGHCEHCVCCSSVQTDDTYLVFLLFEHKGQVSRMHRSTDYFLLSDDCLAARLWLHPKDYKSSAGRPDSTKENLLSSRAKFTEAMSLSIDAAFKTRADLTNSRFQVLDAGGD